MFEFIAGFFAKNPSIAARDPEDPEVLRELRRRKWSVFFAITFGYGFYYVCRLSFSVAKSSMAEAGKMDYAKQALYGLVEAMGPRDRIAVVDFDSDAWTALQPTYVEDAAAEISLDAFRDWLDAERIIMNVNALCKEYSDEAPVFDRIELFAMMARYRKRVGID